jgi:hypothetical protein
MPFIVRSQDPPRADALNHAPIRYVNNVLSELMDGKAAGNNHIGTLQTCH